jgi:hypothetical protein
MLSPRAVRASVTLTHAHEHCGGASPLAVLPPGLTCGAAACADRVVHLVNLWCAHACTDGPAPADGRAWMAALETSCTGAQRWLHRHFQRCVAPGTSEHAWACSWVALMRAADFLNIPSLYWACMLVVRLRCDEVPRQHWRVLFGGALDGAGEAGNAALGTPDPSGREP